MGAKAEARARTLRGEGAGGDGRPGDRRGGDGVRGLDGAALTRSAAPLTGMSPMATGQMIARILIGHIDEHLQSIRKTVSA